MSSSSSSSSSSSVQPRVSIKSTGLQSQTAKRAQQVLQLSAAKRAETLSKRRRGAEENEQQEGAIKPEEAEKIIQQFMAGFIVTLTPASPQYPSIQLNPSVTDAQRSSSLQSLRRLLSADDAPIDLVVNVGAVPLLVHQLSSLDPVAQMDSLWCLTNIASGTNAHTRTVLPSAPTLIALLSSASIKVQEQCVWCLGNLASEEADSRRQLIENGVLVPLIRMLSQGLPSKVPPSPEPVPKSSDPSQQSLLRVVAWTLSNLVKATRTTIAKQVNTASSTNTTPTPTPAQLDSAKHAAAFASAMPTLLPPVLAMLRSEDEQLATECAWLLSAWSNHSDEVLKALCQHGLIESIFSRFYLLQLSPIAATPVVVDPKSGVERDPLAPILIPLVRIIGNAAFADDGIVQAMTRINFVNVANPPVPPNGFYLLFSTLDRSLSSIHRGLKKEVCWVISNLAATQLEDIHRGLLVSSNGPSAFLLKLYDILARGNFDLQREAAHALYNLMRVGEGKPGQSQQVHHTVSPSMHLVVPRHEPNNSAGGGEVTLNLLRSLFDLLKSRDPEATLISLRMIELILRYHPDGLMLVQDNGGIDALESVQTQENAELVAYSHRLVDEFFGVNEFDIDKDENENGTIEEDYPEWRLKSPQKVIHNKNAFSDQPQPPPSGGFQF